MLAYSTAVIEREARLSSMIFIFCGNIRQCGVLHCCSVFWGKRCHETPPPKRSTKTLHYSSRHPNVSSSLVAPAPILVRGRVALVLSGRVGSCGGGTVGCAKTVCALDREETCCG